VVYDERLEALDALGVDGADLLLAVLLDALDELVVEDGLLGVAPEVLVLALGVVVDVDELEQHLVVLAESHHHGLHQQFQRRCG